MKAYHISPRKNRRKIIKEGIKLILGPRSKRFGEREPKIFLTLDLSESVNLINIRFFNSHPDFMDGIDVWEVSIPNQIEMGKDERFPAGFYIKNEINKKNIKLKKSFEWINE